MCADEVAVALLIADNEFSVTGLFVSVYLIADVFKACERFGNLKSEASCNVCTKLTCNDCLNKS